VILPRLHSVAQPPDVGTRIMLVDPYTGGHHAHFLDCLRSYWELHGATGQLHVVVSDAYRTDHAEFLTALEQTPNAQAHTAAVARSGSSRAGLLRKDWTYGRIVEEYAARIRPERILLMYFDHVQLSLAARLRFAWPVAMGGIYFRPTFHYRSSGIRGSGRATALRKRLVLRAALRNPHLHSIFCLDPYAAAWLRAHTKHTKIVHLPEPMDVSPSPHERAPQPLAGIEGGRRKLLVFGHLDERKGIQEIAAALRTLPGDAQEQLALVLAGRIEADARERILAAVAELRRDSSVQVVVDDRYLDGHEIQPLISAADLVLLTYEEHVGSSGVLVRAASARVPVIASDHGLLGRLVERHRLGTTVDAASTAAVARVVAEWLDHPESIPFDARAALGFAAENTAMAFAETIFSNLRV